MKKRRQRRISILLIPDDNAEPYSFRISWLAAKVGMVVLVVLALHLIGGVLGYWQFYKIHNENVELERSNTKLLEDNKRVYRLAAMLEEMDKDQGKIMSLLGVEGRGGTRSPMAMSAAPAASDLPAPPALRAEQAVALSTQVAQTPREMHGNFLRQNRSAEEKVPPSWPSLLPVEGYLSREYSRNPWFPFDGHYGIDIAGKLGSVVMAAGDGHVVYAGWHSELGNLVILHHGGGLFSSYGHNDRLLVREHDFVKRGDSVALLGSSGRSSGPHLHFEIWQEGEAVDPRQYLLALRSSTAEPSKSNRQANNSIMR